MYFLHFVINMIKKLSPIASHHSRKCGATDFFISNKKKLTDVTSWYCSVGAIGDNLGHFLCGPLTRRKMHHQALTSEIADKDVYHEEISTITFLRYA